MKATKDDEALAFDILRVVTTGLRNDKSGSEIVTVVADMLAVYRTEHVEQPKPAKRKANQ